MTPLSRAQFLCFLLVWLAYASTYLLRKPLGVVKADLGEELGVSVQMHAICQSCHATVIANAMMCTSHSFLPLSRQGKCSWVGVILPWFSPMPPYKYCGQGLQTGFYVFCYAHLHTKNWITRASTI